MGASAFVSVIVLLLVYYSFENKVNSYIINKQVIIQLFSYIFDWNFLYEFGLL